MWNRKEDTPAAPPRPASYAPPAANHTPPQAAPAAPRPAVNNGVASIGRGVTVRGDIFSKEDLYVDGDIEGSLTLELNRLTVGGSGKIKANIKAREVVIRGNVQGNVEAADKITIHKDGSLVGDMKMAGIIIEDGAYFKGSIDITRPEK
jgi:cytoskeletal protein CcmA (bactofilin family)